MKYHVIKPHLSLHARPFLVCWENPEAIIVAQILSILPQQSQTCPVGRPQLELQYVHLTLLFMKAKIFPFSKFSCHGFVDRISMDALELEVISFFPFYFFFDNPSIILSTMSLVIFAFNCKYILAILFMTYTFNWKHIANNWFVDFVANWKTLW